MSELICSASSVNSQTGTMEMGLLHLQVKSGHRRSQSKMISILKKKYPSQHPRLHVTNIFVCMSCTVNA